MAGNCIRRSAHGRVALRGLALLSMGLASPGWPAVTVALEPETLVPHPVDSGYEAVLLLSARGLSLEAGVEPRIAIRDAGVGRPLAVSVKQIEPLGGLDGERHWSVLLGFEQLPDIDADTRYLQVTIGEQVDTPLEYTVGLYAAPLLVWSVAVPTREWQLQNKSTTSFTVTVGRMAAHNVRIAHSTLQRTDKRVHLNASDFRLCRTPACDSEVVDLDPDKTHTLHLSAPGATGVTGQFEGGLELLADGAAAYTLPLTIYASHPGRQVLGLALILAGIVMAWFVSVFFKARSARITGLLAASGLRDVGNILSRRIAAATEETGVGFRRFNRALSQLASDLSDQTITNRNYVARKWPSAFGYAAPKEQEYQAYLERQAAILARLSRIESAGIDYIVGHWERVADRESEAAALLEQLDEASGLQDAEKIDTAIGQAIAAMQTLLADGLRPGFAVASAIGVAPSQAASMSTESLEVALTSVSLAVWSLWAVVTAIAGWGALIVTNAGFGTATDLLQCLLWGLGVQVAGHQLQQLTPSSISSAFRISIPAV